MPEGDTVWNHAEQLRKALAGRTLTGSDFRVPQLATVNLTGVTVTESASYGKHLLLRLDNGHTLHSHLRMDGTWRVYSPGQRWSARPTHTIRAVLTAAAPDEPVVAVGFHLHELALVRTRDEQRLTGHLGPDLLGANWDPAEAVRRLLASGGTQIGVALLDQRNLAGIGNLYKAEALFLHRVSPWKPVSEVDDLTGLVELSQRLLAANKGRWTQSTTGSVRPGETHWVYGRRGLCRRCGTPIRRTDQGERVTYWCPVCQP